MLTGKYYTGFLGVCQIPCWTPGVPRVSGAKQGILPLFWGVLAKFIFMVPVTFSGFWGGYCSREGSGGHTMPATMSTERPQNFSQGHEKEGRGTKFGPPPLPYEIRAANFLEFFEEESLVDLAGVAGLAQVVFLEGAGTTGGVSAPASDCFQVGTARGQGVGLAHTA